MKKRIHHKCAAIKNTMKQFKWSLLACALLFPLTATFASSKHVVVKQPGTLAQVLTAKQQKSVTRLAVEGALDASDFKVIRQMACKQSGSLMSLNLSKARVLSKGDVFDVPDSLFAHCDALTDLEMPDSFQGMGQNSFYGCSSLKSITLHDMEYLSYTLFRDMPSLERVTVTGTVLHMDGTPFLNLPKLRSVVFGTSVSTGGPLLAKNCPQLKDVTFRGMVLDSHLQQLDGCPLLTKVRVDGYVGYSRSDLYVGRSLEQGGTVIADSVAHLFQRAMPMAKSSQFFSQVLAGTAYNVACLYSLKNDTANALRMLDISYGFNPVQESYAHILKDTDLDNVRHTPHFAQYAERVRQHTDYLYILRQSPAYCMGDGKQNRRFTYASALDPPLRRVREYFKLDSITGNGDEISRIKNIMYWLHDAIRHDGSGGIPNVPRTAIDLYKTCKDEGRGLNCRGLAIVLSELYLAMGYPARFMTCQSKAYDTDPDCHVICVVWSNELNKWVWMDPSFAAYVSDENGQLLSIAEVRERLRDDKPLVLNEDANWNHQSKQTKEEYLDSYMAKNLYYLSCYMELGANTENGTHELVSLQPSGHHALISDVVTCDDAWFWQAPDMK